MEISYNTINRLLTFFEESMFLFNFKYSPLKLKGKKRTFHFKISKVHKNKCVTIFRNDACSKTSFYK